MGIDYRIKICRKVDDKCLGICNANQLKSIFDSEYAELIHCNNRNCNNVKFTKDDLCAVSTAVFDKIKSLYQTIFEKKLLIALAQNVDIKHELEKEILSLEEDIEEQRWPLDAANTVCGIIDCITENLWDKNDKHAAYEYNGFDLPKKECTYGDGKTYKYSQTVWSNDIYCLIEANY